MASAMAGTRATKRTAASTTDQPRRYVPLTEGAAYLSCSVRHVRDMIARGEITGYRLGTKAVRVDLAELDAALSIIPTGGRLAATRGRDAA